MDNGRSLLEAIANHLHTKDVILNHQSPFHPSSEDNTFAPLNPLIATRQQEVIQLLKQVIEPKLKNDIVSLGMVRNLRIVDDYLYLRLYIGSHQHHLQAEIQSILSSLSWYKKIVYPKQN